MFRSIRAANKLRKCGYKIKASKTMPMCYEILNAETGERVKKKWFIAINQNSAWYPTKNFKEKTLMVYPTPEEAALRLMCNEWL